MGLQEIYRIFEKIATFIENITTSDTNFAPNIINYYRLPDKKFNASLITVNLNIFYTLV